MRLLGNIIWVVFGGFLIALEYFVASIALFATIIGIPFGLQTLKLAALAIWPFEREIRNKDSATGCLSTFMNLIWIMIGGIWISLTHVVFGLLFAITIVGIPFAKQHFKLAALALVPFGKEIV